MKKTVGRSLSSQLRPATKDQARGNIGSSIGSIGSNIISQESDCFWLQCLNHQRLAALSCACRRYLYQKARSSSMGRQWHYTNGGECSSISISIRPAQFLDWRTKARDSNIEKESNLHAIRFLIKAFTPTANKTPMQQHTLASADVSVPRLSLDYS